MPSPTDSETIDDFLGGAVRLIQPKAGYRVSMDTVLLAAAVPALSGETVLEGGVGTGGAAICLAHRTKGVHVAGIDLQAGMIELARRNVLLNNLSTSVSIEEGCITDLSGPQSQYDHVMLNPPYLPAGKAIKPPEEGKGIAHMESNASLKDWLRFAIHKVKNKGTVTIVCRADRLDEIIAHLYRRVGDLIIMPLWPRAGVAAKRVIIQGRKGMRGGATLSPGLILHGTEDRYTAKALSILMDGEALDLKAFASKA
ncbi:MAG: methyltransferase [Kordiimonadales bacterium]|nr:MAG: methyltransferase [Kordiimonadales bacterium]